MPFPPARKKEIQFRDMSKIASEIEGELKNIHFEKNPDNNFLYPKKNLGYILKGTNSSLPGAKRGLGIAGYTPSVGSSEGVYAAWDDATPDVQIYKLGGADPTSQGASARFATNDTDVEFTQVNDDLYVSNGTDTSLKLTGSSGSWGNAGGAEPYSGAGVVAKHLTWHNFMLFASRTVNAPNKLNVSDAGDPTTFSGNTKSFPYAIIGQRSLDEQLAIYTEKTIHIVTGFEPANLYFREVEHAHPCVSGRSIVTVPSEKGTIEHFYLGADYVWAFNGTGFRRLGQDSWDNIRANLNTDKIELAAAYYDTTTKQYRISVCTGANTRNDTTYAYDTRGDLWVKLPNHSFCDFAEYGTPTPTFYAQEASASGYAFELNSGNNHVYPFTLIDMVGDLDTTTTTITVDSTSDFDSSGYIVIDGETIQYTSKTATTFAGCTRGSNGTTAATHTDNTEVYKAPEYQYSTRFLDDNNPNLFKKYKRGWVDLKASTTAYNLMISMDVDQLGSSVVANIPLLEAGATWGSFNWGDGTTYGAPAVIQYSNTRFLASGRGREVKFKFNEYSNVQQTELFNFEYQYRILRKR